MKIGIHLATIRTRHSTNLFADISHPDLNSQLAEYCVEHWVESLMGPVPESHLECIAEFIARSDETTTLHRSFEAIPVCLHDEGIEEVVLAAAQAYESVRLDAAKAARKDKVPLALAFDRIGCGEDETPFGYGPVASMRMLHPHGTAITTVKR